MGQPESKLSGQLRCTTLLPSSSNFLKPNIPSPKIGLLDGNYEVFSWNSIMGFSMKSGNKSQFKVFRLEGVLFIQSQLASGHGLKEFNFLSIAPAMIKCIKNVDELS